MGKVLKVLHTLAACGLIGGLLAYVILLALGPQQTPADYAAMRQSIALVSNYLLLPSLAVAMVSGLLSMAWQPAFLNKGWAWLKAAMGILMFKAVLTIVGSKADYAAAMSRRMAEGTAPADALDAALAYEWETFAVILALSLANVVLGIWRPRLSREKRRAKAVAVSHSSV